MCVIIGTAMSNTYGIAKKATAIDVRVLGANGGGTIAWVQIMAILCISGLHTEFFLGEN